MSVLLYKGRDWSLEEGPAGARFVIPAPRIWPLALFFSFWLAGWTAGEVSAAKQAWALLSGGAGGWELLPAAFLLFWLAGWTAGGLFAWGVFLFSLSGREVVTLREGELCIRAETVLGLGWTWKYPLAGMTPPKLVVTDLKTDLPAAARDPGLDLRYGYLAIESGGRRWRLGLGLEERRAAELLHTLSSRFGLPHGR